VKNSTSSITKQLAAKYLTKDKVLNNSKSTDINILLNRVKLNQRDESRKKLYFSAAASTGLFVFALIIF